MLAEKRLQKDISVLQADLQKLVGDIEEASKMGVAESKTEQDSSARLQETIDEVQSLLTRAKNRMQHKGEQAMHTVEEHPLASLAAALGVGVLLGKLLNQGH